MIPTGEAALAASHSPLSKPGLVSVSDERRAFALSRRPSMHWYVSCSYEPQHKRRFHSAARTRLRHLAAELGFSRTSFDLRSNKGGIAVSGEITLHHEHVYIQVCQPVTRADSGIPSAPVKDGGTIRAGAITSRRYPCSITFRLAHLVRTVIRNSGDAV